MTGSRDSVEQRRLRAVGKTPLVRPAARSAARPSARPPARPPGHSLIGPHSRALSNTQQGHSPAGPTCYTTHLYIVGTYQI